MILITDNLIVNVIEFKDIGDIINIYNSNKEFLKEHMDRDKITIEWLKEELEEMKKLEFNTYKLIEKKSGKTIGFLDLRIAEESYLSLLMIHNKYKNKGYGKEIYTKLEEYLKSNIGKSIRIDVVTDYNKNVEQFWIRNGFKKVENIEMNWAGRQLTAAIMKKYF